MKNDSGLKKIFILLTALFIFSSCSDLFKDDPEPEPRDNYLVSYELEKSYLPSFIETLFENLIDDFPELASVQDRVKHGVIIYSIKYNTTFKGENVVASGLVCIPIGEGPFPVISYQNGTNTLHREAPSVNPDRDLYLLLEFAASTGFIISLPDYLGFGASENMFHPYLHQESTVQTVIDMLRAVNELTTNWLETNAKDELYLTGYSQGGWSTMQVQKAIEENYADEFNLVASSPAAGPYNLKFINDYVLSQTNYPMPYFMGYLFNSYLNLGLISIPPAKVFEQPYASKITTLYNGSKSGEEINAELTTKVDELFTSDFLTNYKTGEDYQALQIALAENSIEGWKSQTPMLLAHGTADTFIPAQVTSDIYQEFLAKGVNPGNITLLPLPGLGHTEGVIPAGLAALEWFYNLSEN